MKNEAFGISFGIYRQNPTTMKTINLAISLSLILSLLISCATPQPLSKLSTESPDSQWVSGRQYIQKEVNAIGIRLAYYKNEDDLLVFDAYIDNYSDEILELNPTHVELISLNTNKEIISTVRAVDPEKMLKDYDTQEAREKAQLANETTANAVFATTDLVATIADESNSKLSEEEKDRRFNQRLYWTNDRLANTEQQENYIEHIKNTRLYWEEIPIRRTDLKPKHFLDGRLFFNRNTQASYYQVVFHLPNDKLVFDFKQDMIPTKYHADQ